MNIEEIKQELQEVLKEEYISPLTRLKEYYEQVLAYDIFRPNDENTLHPATLLLASLSVNSPDTYQEKATKIDEFMEKGLLDNFSELSGFYLYFQKLGKKNQEKIQQCFYTSENDKLQNIFDTLQDETKEEDCASTLKYLLDYLEETPMPLKEITSVMEMLFSLNEEEKESFRFFAYYSILISNIDDDPDFSIHQFPKEEANCLRKNYNAIVDQYRSLEKEIKNERKEFLKRQEACECLLKKLEHPLKGYLRLTENEMKYLPPKILDNMENMYLVWNQRILEKVEQELEIYNGNKEAKLRELFQKYSISFFQNQDFISVVTNLQMEEVEEKLNFIKNYFDNLKEEELFRILCMDKDLLKKITPYLITNIITATFFIQNILLFQEKTVLDQVENNYKLLKNYSLNCKMFNEVLLLSDEVLKSKIQKIESYGLPITEEVISASFLPNFFNVYEIWIEKGISHLFLSNLFILKTDLVGITKRILLCLSLQISVFDENGSLNTLVTSQNKFFLSDEELDSYLDKSLVQKLVRKFKKNDYF